MADTTTLNPGVGGDVIDTDDIGAYKIPVSKIKLGADGVDGGLVTTSNPLPVEVQNASIAVTGSFYQATQPVSAASLPLPTGASTAALQTSGNASLTSLDGKVTACNTGAVVVSSGSINATCSGTVAISGSVAVTGPLTDAELRATAVPVSGTFWQATQPVSGTVTANQGGTWSLRVTDGANTATVRDLTGGDALNVAMVDGSGNQITSFGGGTQYTEGDVDASFTGTAVIWEDAGDTARAVSKLKAMPVQIAPSYGNNVYVCSVLDAAVTTNIVILSLYNADAALKVEILRMVVFPEPAAAGTGLIRGFRAFRFTTLHSGGTVGTARKLDTGMDNLDADITTRNNNVTIGGAEAEPLAACSIYEEETGGSSGQVEMFNWTQLGVPITLNQNEGVAIQRENVASVATTSALIYFRVR